MGLQEAGLIVRDTLVWFMKCRGDFGISLSPLPFGPVELSLRRAARLRASRNIKRYGLGSVMTTPSFPGAKVCEEESASPLDPLGA